MRFEKCWWPKWIKNVKVKCENEIFASTPSGRHFGSNGLIPLQKNDEVDYLRAPSGRQFGSNGFYS